MKINFVERNHNLAKFDQRKPFMAKLVELLSRKLKKRHIYELGFLIAVT